MNVRVVRATRGDDAHIVVEHRGKVVGHGFFRRLYGPTGELRVVAGADGAALILVEALVAQAGSCGVTRLVADLDAADVAALSAVRAAGRTREHVVGDRIEVELFARPQAERVTSTSPRSSA